MGTDFPAGIDDFGSVVEHELVRASHMNDVRLAIAAIEGQVGVTGSLVSNSLRYQAKYQSPSEIVDGIIYVGPNSEYTTVEAGLDAAASGETVFVLPGTYEESGLEVPDNVNLIGSGRSSDIAKSDNTTFIVKCYGHNLVGNMSIRNTADPAGGAGHGLEVGGTTSTDVNVRNCYIRAGDDSLFCSPVGYMTIQGCTIAGGYDLCRCGDGLIYISGCNFKGDIEKAGTECSAIMSAKGVSSVASVVSIGNFVDMGSRSGLGSELMYFKLVSNAIAGASVTTPTPLSMVFDGSDTTFTDVANSNFRPQMVGEVISFHLSVLPTTVSGTVLKWISSSEILISGDVTGANVPEYIYHSFSINSKISSFGNVVKIHSLDSDISGFSGPVGASRPQNYKVNSGGDNFEFSGGGTILGINAANSGNQFTAHNGNLFQYGVTTTGDVINVPVGTEENANKIGFYNTDPVTKLAGVGVNVGEVHAALVRLGLIGA